MAAAMGMVGAAGNASSMQNQIEGKNFSAKGPQLNTQAFGYQPGQQQGFGGFGQGPQSFSVLGQQGQGQGQGTSLMDIFKQFGSY